MLFIYTCLHLLYIVYICLFIVVVQDNIFDTGTELRTKLFERYLKIRDPFDAGIPEEYETHHYLTAPFKKDQQDL